MAKTPQLVDRYGQPLQREVLTAEIAGPTITGVRSPLSGHPGDGLNPRRLAAILREADEGEPQRYFELAETIEERDHHYAGVLGTRRRSVAQLELTVESASSAAEDVARADMVREWLTRHELQDELFDLLDAIGKGVSYTEIMWDTSSGDWWPARLEWRDPRWFRFRRDDLETPLLRTDEGDIDLPAFKFVRAVMRAKSGLPVRSGIARVAMWSWMFKAFTGRDWAIFTQNYGQPIRVGKYPAGASERDKETLFRAVANIAGDCAAIVPESMLIEFIESKTVGASHQLYKERADWLDQQVSKLVLGQTTTTDAVSGGHAVAREHRLVQEDIERADARTLGAALNRDLIRPWMDLQFQPHPKKLYPSLRIGRAKERDQKLTLEAVKTLVPMGLRVEKSVVGDIFGLPDAPPNAEVLEAPRQAPAIGEERDPDDPAADEDEETATQAARADVVDRLADAAETIVGPGTDALIDAIRNMIGDASSLEEVRDRLLALRPGMPAAGLAALMRLALTMAELSGRSEIVDQVGT